jgi:hypothetical protein
MQTSHTHTTGFLTWSQTKSMLNISTANTRDGSKKAVTVKTIQRVIKVLHIFNEYRSVSQPTNSVAAANKFCGCETDLYSLDIIQANGDDKYQNNLHILHIFLCTVTFPWSYH